jgi:ABC-type antimicrobial peptide transport system permease subunit
MFSGEIIAISTIASIPGILFMSYVLNAITQVPYVAKLFIVNPYTIILSITIVFIFNLVVGLLPVYRTIRKTPAQILSRFDVD